MFNKTLSVEELNGYIHSIFDAEEMLHGVTVFGEVSGFKISGAHAYFTIKGKDAAIPCNLFSYRRTYVPKEGESVIVKGSPDYYVKTGRLSFNVQTVQPVGIGDLHAQFERLKAQLLSEGIFAPEHKVAIPPFCKDVCVITSKTGAVIRDIYRTVRNVNKSINLHLFNVRVQGEGAENEIVNALKRVDGVYDAIIIARGGGSLEDLAPFNTEALARAVYAAETPVISAVGHETDWTVADLVADLRAPTPSAAAELVVQPLSDWQGTVLDLSERLNDAVIEELDDRCEAVMSLLKHYALREPTHIVETLMQKVDDLDMRFKREMDVKLERYDSKLKNYKSVLEAIGPLAVLKRGYGILEDEQGEAIVSADSLRKKGRFSVRMSDGSVKAKVIDEQ